MLLKTKQTNKNIKQVTKRGSAGLGMNLHTVICFLAQW